MAGVLLNAYLELLAFGRYSDFIIHCQGYEFKVHRAIVCAASPMLDKACGGLYVEASEGRIDLSEDDPEILARVLLYLYTNDYEAKTVPSYLEGVTRKSESQSVPAISSVQPKENEALTRLLRIHALVYRSADMLGVEGLKGIASSRFLDVAEIALTLAPDTLAEPLKIMFDSTRENDLRLRNPVLILCLENHAIIAEHKPIVEMMLKYEPTVWNIKQSLLKESKPKTENRLGILKPWYDCAGCNKEFHKDEILKYRVDESLRIEAWCGLIWCGLKCEL
ncbi:hypothetical protein EDD37DRAFT_647835 [Exophiala viscosa]|uniref:BTB domain-containing protein n=1 Tax=Exophiala viscosa TaxID=2486360 RepID=A0AAN6E876_9EURO|nr:hypothetical protein EDD36DRAFT_48827 [Exophiala viscosa]KAI1628182.1 hypothetical protein EDD37DRAFT_647835 [Exophiala viscosa]